MTRSATVDHNRGGTSRTLGSTQAWARKIASLWRAFSRSIGDLAISKPRDNEHREPLSGGPPSYGEIARPKARRPAAKLEPRKRKRVSRLGEPLPTSRFADTCKPTGPRRYHRGLSHCRSQAIEKSQRLGALKGGQPSPWHSSWVSRSRPPEPAFEPVLAPSPPRVPRSSRQIRSTASVIFGPHLGVAITVSNKPICAAVDRQGML
jgi:hypothetical protein